MVINLNSVNNATNITRTSKTKIMNQYFISKRTFPLKKNTKKGTSKKEDWIAGGDIAKLVNITNEIYTFNMFQCSNSQTLYSLDAQRFHNEFKKAEYNDEGKIINSEHPTLIDINEFDIRDDVCKLYSNINKIKNNDALTKEFKDMMDDKIEQIRQAQGAGKCLTIPQFYEYQKNKTNIPDNITRISKPIFNRKSRWTPTVPYNFEHSDFMNHPSYPAPIGIRPKDYALPSELLETTLEMITQLVNFKNVNEKDVEIMKQAFSIEQRNTHCCKYCGDCMNMNDYSSSYSSKTNYTEICHRDPNDRFLSYNMYWGHGECNRKQGGYSEKQIMFDALKLMKLHKLISIEEYQQKFDLINTLQ